MLALASLKAAVRSTERMSTVVTPCHAFAAGGDSGKRERAKAMGLPRLGTNIGRPFSSRRQARPSNTIDTLAVL